MKNTINAVAKMAPWGGLPKRRVGSNTHRPRRGTNPNLTDPQLLIINWVNPYAPVALCRYPDRKERGWHSGQMQRMLEKSKSCPVGTDRGCVPHADSGPTSNGSLVTRTSGKQSSEVRADDSDIIAGAHFTIG